MSLVRAAMVRAVGLEGTTLGEALAGRPDGCSACGGLAPQTDWVRSLFAFLICPPLLCLFVPELYGEWERTRWVPVQAEVVASHLDERGHQRRARVEVRYDFAGEPQETSLYRNEARYVRSLSEVKEERSFLAAHPVGRTITIYPDPERPHHVVLDPAAKSMTIFVGFLLLIGSVVSCGPLARWLWVRSVHAGCEQAPRCSGPGLDHRSELSQPRWLGPRSNLTFLALAALGLAALFKGNPTTPWVLGVIFTAAVTSVFLGRLLQEAIFYYRWRNTRLRLEEPHGFAPGESFLATLRPSRPRARYAVEFRREELLDEEDKDEEDDPLGWKSEVLRSLPVEVEHEGGVTTARWTLPPDAERPWRKGGERRERWVLRAAQGSREVLFELDFSPLEFPAGEPPEPEVRAPSLDATRERAAAELGQISRPVRPKWLDPSAPLNQVYRDIRTLQAKGKVVWGRVVQANSMLYEPGRTDLPAVVVFADGDGVGPHELAWIAVRLYASRDEPIDRLSQLVDDERADFFRYPGPAWLTGGREVFFSTMMFFREHLHQGHLTSRDFPLVVAPEHTRAVLALPYDLWGEDLKAWARRA